MRMYSAVCVCYQTNNRQTLQINGAATIMLGDEGDRDKPQKLAMPSGTYDWLGSLTSGEPKL